MAASRFVLKSCVQAVLSSYTPRREGLRAVPTPKATTDERSTQTVMAQSKASNAQTSQVDEDLIDPNALSKRKMPVEAVHLNVRITGDDARILDYLQRKTPGITDSLRVRDCIRTAVFLLAMKDRGTPVVLPESEDSQTEILEHLGVFMPELGMKPTRRRVG
jgi:hypothetical protein